MDLKEMVLSAIADLEATEQPMVADDVVETMQDPVQEPVVALDPMPAKELDPVPAKSLDLVQEQVYMPAKQSDEVEFLSSMKDRLLVIFEGLQSPNNQSSEAKVDLVLNFLEYLLAVVEERIEAKQKGV